jgi:dihydrofolate reductase
VAKISIIAAISKQRRALGNKNRLLWHLPADLKRFKELTTGHPIIMGWNTYKSIGHPLPDRTNIVISDTPQVQVDSDYKVAGSLDEAIKLAQQINEEEIFIVGGGETYKQALPIAEKLYLTIVDDEPEADVFFPEYANFSKVVFEKENQEGDIKYAWIDLERLPSL